MSAFLWWRSWYGAPMDHKWPVIAARAGVKVGIVSAVAWALLDYAGQHEVRGTVDGFDTEAYAIYSGFEEDDIKAVILAMNDKDVIKDGRLVNWDKRQPKSESEIGRVTEWREKKQSETNCNALLRDVTKKYTDTDSDKDTDKEKEREEEEKEQPPRPEIYTMYEQNIGTLTPMISDALDADVKDYTYERVEFAIKEAVRNEVRKLSYIEGILKNKNSTGKKKTGGIDEAETLRLKLRAEAKEYGFQ